MTVILDSSAVLAMVFGEPGGGHVLSKSRGALLSAVNADEVFHKVARKGIDRRDVETQLTKLAVEITAFDTAQARLCAALHPRVAGTDRSFADRACLSLGMATGWPILTADDKWLTLGLDLDIRLIR